MNIKLTYLGALILLPFLALAQVTNQNLYDTAPNLVAHYHERLDMFKKQAVQKGKIIFVGNSITEGGEHFKLIDNVERLNRGIGGDVTFGLLNRLDEIIRHEPQKIFIMIGINDISKDFPDGVIADNYKKIIDRIQLSLPATKIFIQSILPVNPQYKRFPQHYDKGDHVIAVNKRLFELSIAENVSFINLYPLFLDQQNRMNESYTTDGLHLNEAGYKVWISYLKENKYL